MIKSMTGYSKAEMKENSTTVTVEIKSLNGRFLEISCRMPKQLQHKEIEVREIIKSQILRGTLSININVEEEAAEQTFNINLDAAEACYNTLNDLRKRLKFKSVVDMKDVLVFSNQFQKLNNEVDEEFQTKLLMKAVREAVKNLETMRKREGAQISKDIFTRMKKIQDTVKKIEISGAERIPQEREKLRQRVAQLFESDEYDEQRIQMENATAGTGVMVSQTADNRLMLNIPSDISFDTGSAQIKPGFRPILDSFATSLLNNPGTQVTIVGHTDNTGSDAVNNPLSINRAASTREYLAGRGVPFQRIQIDGRGSYQPAASNDTAARRAKNRRVEIYVSETQGGSIQ